MITIAVWYLALYPAAFVVTAAVMNGAVFFTDRVERGMVVFFLSLFYPLVLTTIAAGLILSGLFSAVGWLAEKASS